MVIPPNAILTVKIFKMSSSAYICRRDPRIVSYFRPYESGDVVTLGDKDWSLAQGMHGWYLTDTGDYKGAHPAIRNVLSMTDLIRYVEREFVNLQHQPA